MLFFYPAEYTGIKILVSHFKDLLFDMYIDKLSYNKSFHSIKYNGS